MEIPMEETVVLGFYLISVVFLAVMVVLFVLFLRTLSRALGLAGEHSRMSPQLVYLNLIPLFNLGWLIYTVVRVSEAIKGRCNEIGQDPGDGGYGVGLAYAICMLCVILPCIGILAFIAGIVLWIIYWVKITDCIKLMQADPVQSATG